MIHEALLACRRLFDEQQTTQRQPLGSDQSARKPAEALLPGEQADSTPVLRQPMRDLRQPKAERLLHAEHEEAQLWRSQAMRLSKELQSVHSAGRSERRAFVAQLRRARNSMAGAVSQFEHDRKQIAKLARLSEYWEEQFQQSAAARETEARAAKIAQTEVFMAAQKVVFQRRDEQEARAAAEERAADLERELSAQQSRLQYLEDQCRRSADKAEVTQQLGAVLKSGREAKAAAEQRAADLEQKLSAQQVQVDSLEDQLRRISADNEQITEQGEALVSAEREARAAAEQRAAVLDQELSAQQIQIDSLEDQCRRISADKDEVVERCETLLNAEREARTAAESRAAALELRLEAESLRTEELVGENRRISAENAQVSRDFQAALLALGDLDLSASQACSEEVRSKLSSARWKVACSREWNCQDAMSLPCALPSSLHMIQVSEALTMLPHDDAGAGQWHWQTGHLCCQCR